MKPADISIERYAGHVERIAAHIRDDLARLDCPEPFVAAACAAAEQAAARALQAAEARERTRIIRWLRAVSQVYAERFRAGEGEDSIYWADQLEAFTHAADAIARRRHAKPH